MAEKYELWDIYNEKKERTGRTMKRNDWCLKDGEYHLTVLGVIKRTEEPWRGIISIWQMMSII